MKILFLAVAVLALMVAIPGARLAADDAPAGMQTAALYSSRHSAIVADEHFGARSTGRIPENTLMSSGATRPVQLNQFMFLLLFLLILVAAVEFGVRVQAERRREPADKSA